MAIDRSQNDDLLLWIRSGSSFREALSRGSQTTMDDFDEEFHQESHPVTPATNVRRASFLLGGLRTIYSPPQRASKSSLPPAISVQPEVRNPPSSVNPWSIHYRDEVLPELDRVCQYREVCSQKCCSFRKEMETRSMANFFLHWRRSNLRHLTKNLASTIERNNTNFYKQRRVRLSIVLLFGMCLFVAPHFLFLTFCPHISSLQNKLSCSLVKVWSHVSIGLSEKEVLQRGSKELVSETIAQRLLRKHKHKGSSTITTGIIDEEIDHMAGISMDTWLSGYYKTTYFLRWREIKHLPSKYFNKKRCRAVISCWILQAKSDRETIDYSCYKEAKSFHSNKVTKATLQKWREENMRAAQKRRKLRSVCVRLSQSIEDKQKENLLSSIQQWTKQTEMNRVYRTLPFQRWRDLTLNEKYRSRIQIRLLFVYMRAKRRRQTWSIFREWKHQSIYGRVTTLYTRNELAFRWMQQKRRYEQLLSDIPEQVSRLEEQLRQSEAARTAVEQELSKLTELRGANNNNIAFSGADSFRESLTALCPLLMHGENLL